MKETLKNIILGRAARCYRMVERLNNLRQIDKEPLKRYKHRYKACTDQAQNFIDQTGTNVLVVCVGNAQGK
nr:hypothetical protein [Tanacetum cinerariifolium]